MVPVSCGRISWKVLISHCAAQNWPRRGRASIPTPPLLSRGGEGWGPDCIHRGRKPGQAGKVETRTVTAWPLPSIVLDLLGFSPAIVCSGCSPRSILALDASSHHVLHALYLGSFPVTFQPCPYSWVQGQAPSPDLSHAYNYLTCITRTCTSVQGYSVIRSADTFFPALFGFIILSKCSQPPSPVLAPSWHLEAHHPQNLTGS